MSLHREVQANFESLFVCQGDFHGAARKRQRPDAGRQKILEIGQSQMRAMRPTWVSFAKIWSRPL